MSQGIVVASEQVGGTADVQIAAAIALLPNGGIVDCEDYGATKQTIAATLTVPSSITLRFNPATTFAPGSASMTMFNVQGGSRICGLTVNAGTFSGIVFNFAGTYMEAYPTILRDINVVSPQNVAGTAFRLSSSAVDSGIGSIVFDGISIQGLEYGFYLIATGPGWVNGNLFSNLVISLTKYGVYATTIGTGAAISGNSFSNYFWEATDGAISGANAINMEGVSGSSILQNTFSGLNLWDAATPIVCNNYAKDNLFIGRWGGWPADFPPRNTYLCSPRFYQVEVFFQGLWNWIKSKL